MQRVITILRCNVCKRNSNKNGSLSKTKWKYVLLWREHMIPRPNKLNERMFESCVAVLDKKDIMCTVILPS